MKKVIVNRIKLICSAGRIEKGETVVLPDAEVAKILKGRPDIIRVLEDVTPAATAATPKPRKPRNAKSNTFN